MIALIPTQSIGNEGAVATPPFYTMRTKLDGEDFYLTFTYVQRGDYWKMSIADAAQIDIVNGIKVVCNWPLLHRFQYPNLPLGEFIAVSNTTDNDPPGLDELGIGKRVELVYYDRAEIQAAGGI